MGSVKEIVIKSTGMKRLKINETKQSDQISQ